MPLVQVCGVNQRLRASASSPNVRVRSMPDREHGVRLVDVEGVGVERGEQLRQGARHLAARDADAGGGAQPGEAAQVRPREAAPPPTGRPSSRSSVIAARAPRPDRAAGARSPAIRQPWLRSTMMSIVVADGRAHGAHRRDPVLRGGAGRPGS